MTPATNAAGRHAWIARGQSNGLDVARWLMATLPSPSDTSQPLVLTEAQIDFLVAMYATDGDQVASGQPGRPRYRRVAWQGPKGIGKSPFAAMLSVAEFAGPPAAPDPLVQIAALSEEQADSTVYSLVLGMIRANDRRVAKALGIDDGRGRLYLTGRPGKLEAVTSAAGSHEGERTTFAVLDETHLWTKRNGGEVLARTIRRNVAKSGGRSLELSNAHEPGAGSVAEATEADYLAGRPGILFVSRRPSTMPDPSMTDEQIAALVEEVYRGAPWIDPQRILAEIRDPATPWDEACRYFLNAPHSAERVLVDPARWAALVSTTVDIPDGTRVGIGFDGSHAHDGTAVVIVDESGRTSLELLIEREPSDPPGWTVPRREVHDTIADLFGRFDVARLYADPWGWRDELDEWADKYGEEIVLPLPTNSVRRFGPAVDRWRSALAEGRISHNGDADLARHLANARLVAGPGRAADSGHQVFTLEKAAAGRLIDAAVAAVNAYEAMATAPAAEPVYESYAAWA